MRNLLLLFLLGLAECSLAQEYISWPKEWGVLLEKRDHGLLRKKSFQLLTENVRGTLRCASLPEEAENNPICCFWIQKYPLEPGVFVLIITGKGGLLMVSDENSMASATRFLPSIIHESSNEKDVKIKMGVFTNMNDKTPSLAAPQPSPPPK